MKFNLFTLGELVTIKYGKNQKKVQSEDGAIPIYGTGGLMGYATDALYDKPSVLIGRKGTINKVRYVDHPFWTVDTLFYTEVNEELAIPKYLYYLMSLLDLDSYNEGTTIPSLRTETLNRLEFDIPDLDYQGKVLSILEPIDKKINLNEEVNKNLEQQIRSLCNAWLNDYEPFGGVCPDDWELTPLSSFAQFISGYSYKGAELQNSSVAMATIKNFDRKGGFKLDGYKEIVPSSKLKPEHHANLFDTLVAHTDLTQNAEVIGNAEPVLSFSGYQDIIFSMDVVKVLPTNPQVSKFLIAALLQTQKFKGHCLGYVNGTTVLHLSKKALPEYSLLMPKDFSILKPLDNAVSVMYQRMASNIDENVHLTLLRDSILPRLMSGELNVSELEL